MERVTITLTPEMAEAVRGAVSGGDYASTSEIMREALRDWQVKREVRRRDLEALRDEIRIGEEAIRAGRVSAFDPEAIIRQGERKLSQRSSSK